MTNSMRILIADDHAIVRRGLKQILADEADVDVIGEAGDAHEVRKLVREKPWDVVVLDLNMPGGTGLDLLNEIKSLRPELPVLIVSIFPVEQFGVRVIRAGAAGYLTKDSAPEELVAAIRKEREGGKYISPSRAENIASAMSNDSSKLPHESLSDREFEVLLLIAKGKTVSQIAEQLILSVKTVSTYRSRILEKLAMSSSAELMHYAIRQGLAERA